MIAVSRDWIDQAVGTPFESRGSDRAGWDCWGLVRAAFRELARVELHAYPVHAYDALAVARATKAEQKSGTWRPIPIGEEQALDVVQMRTLHASGHAAELHVGLVVRPGRLIHVEEPAGTMCVPFDHFTVADRLRTIWRHAALDAGARP